MTTELPMESVFDALERRPGVCSKRAVLTRSVVALEIAQQGPYVVILAEETSRSLIPAGLQVVDLAERLSEFDTAVFYRESLRQTEPFERLLSRLKDCARTRNLFHPPKRSLQRVGGSLANNTQSRLTESSRNHFLKDLMGFPGVSV